MNKFMNSCNQPRKRVHFYDDINVTFIWELNMKMIFLEHNTKITKSTKNMKFPKNCQQLAGICIYYKIQHS